MHARVNAGCQGKRGPGKIHKVILVLLVKATKTAHHFVHYHAERTMGLNTFADIFSNKLKQ